MWDADEDRKSGQETLLNILQKSKIVDQDNVHYIRRNLRKALVEALRDQSKHQNILQIASMFRDNNHFHYKSKALQMCLWSSRIQDRGQFSPIRVLRHWHALAYSAFLVLDDIYEDKFIKEYHRSAHTALVSTEDNSGYNSDLAEAHLVLWKRYFKRHYHFTSEPESTYQPRISVPILGVSSTEGYLYYFSLYDVPKDFSWSETISEPLLHPHTALYLLDADFRRVIREAWEKEGKPPCIWRVQRHRIQNSNDQPMPDALSGESHSLAVHIAFYLFKNHLIYDESSAFLGIVEKDTSLLKAVDKIKEKITAALNWHEERDNPRRFISRFYGPGIDSNLKGKFATNRVPLDLEPLATYEATKVKAKQLDSEVETYLTTVVEDFAQIAPSAMCDKEKNGKTLFENAYQTPRVRKKNLNTRGTLSQTIDEAIGSEQSSTLPKWDQTFKQFKDGLSPFHILLHGRAGYGKTSTTYKTAADLAQETLETYRSQGTLSYIPIYLPLSENNALLKPVEAVRDRIKNKYSQILSDYLADLLSLNTGRIFLILDALDQRGDILSDSRHWSAVKKAYEKFSETSILITMRSPIANADRLDEFLPCPKATQNQFELQGFDIPEQEAYRKCWEKSKNPPENVPSSIGQQGEATSAEKTNNSPADGQIFIKDLYENPFFLSMICEMEFGKNSITTKHSFHNGTSVVREMIHRMIFAAADDDTRPKKTEINTKFVERALMLSFAQQFSACLYNTTLKRSSFSPSDVGRVLYSMLP